MSKKFHLVCNAHLDPIWQWEWEEGAASALSTFKSASDLCKEFDYIFCHNEVTLYKYIEEYAPDLFEDIRKHIRNGKWKIVGGWYLQPDCNMPCGESFVRQIQFGRNYFRDRFGVEVKTAYNVDAFGHTAGLVQIMKKCGQENCIIVRKGDDPVEDTQLIWEGFDGSKIKLAALRGYHSALGKAVEKINRVMNESEHDVDCIMWGVGNHGGGPSRKDLSDIKKLIDESEVELCHSTPDAFFDEIEPTYIHKNSFTISMPGCYTSVSKVKQSHADFEDTLYMTEKLCSVAALQGLIEYPEKELCRATEDLLTAEFHDVLPGSSIKIGEENGLMILSHGKNILNKLRAKAYFALTSAQPKAKEGEFPFLVFNPNPYEWETEVECEFMLADQNWEEDIVSSFRVVDSEGNEIPSQFVKEISNFTLDWRKRVVFKAKLAPMAISRFSVYVEFVEKKAQEKKKADENIVFKSERAYIEISRKTGLLTSYKIDGVEYVQGDAFCLCQYDDNADPWAMGSFQLETLGTNKKSFSLMEKPDGVFADMESVQIIEDGALRLSVEAFFRLDNSRARIEYVIHKETGVLDVKVDMFAGEVNKMYRLAIPVKLEGQYRGQTAFGTQPLYMNGRECVAQRFVYVKGEDKCLALFNKGTYGSKFLDGSMEMSLLRTATYCTHPIRDRQLLPLDRYTQKIDCEERSFSFRLCVTDEECLERLSQEFTTPPYALNVFPIETKKKPKQFTMKLANKNIALTTFKKAIGEEEYILRFLNNSEKAVQSEFALNGEKISLSFKPFEAKTVIYNGVLKEIEEMRI
ncbi:MAG: alpha-mannosidase [Clostridia bacterium]|nr:alpha-mannosidase [Clostridia bacterium]